MSASVVGGGGGGSSALNTRPPVRRAEAARTSARPGDGAADLRAQLGRIPGISTYMKPVQNLSIGGALVQEPVSARHAGPRHAAAHTIGRRRWPMRWARDRALSPTSRSDLQNNAAAGDARGRQRQGELARHLGRRSCARRSMRVRQPADLDDLRTGDSYQVIIELDREIAWSPERVTAHRGQRPRAAGWCRSAPSPASIAPPGRSPSTSSASCPP